MIFDDLLNKVEKPARYIGGEYGVPNMHKPHQISTCIVFPDTYEIGMSNLGIRILYNILNSTEGVVCERCFAPWIDLGKLLKENDIPLPSIETKKPLKDFDLLGFSLQYELLYSNVLYVLDLAKIPFYASERNEEYPIIIAGGPCSANPEPFADFFDLICIGEGEEVIKEIAEILKKHKGNKNRIIIECEKITGVYSPKRTANEPQFKKKTVQKAIVKDLNTSIYPINPIVPSIPIIHDRPVAELYRGCYSNCRFCQASFFYRPIRIRTPKVLKEQINKMINFTGCEEIGISSLSSGDYPGLKELFDLILPDINKNKVKLQLPSLRLDSFTPEIVDSCRKTGSLTFAPEAGTQRLRNVINKKITDEDVERTMKMAFESGYRSVKLYFMIGLPTETEEDILGITLIAKKIKEIYKAVTRRNDITINVSSSVFVPKPVTPFQWYGQISMDEMREKHKFLRNELKKIKGINYSWSDERISFLEALFARGDRSLSKLIEKAYYNGAKFDSWNELFNFDAWNNAIEFLKIDTIKYTGEQKIDEYLPWDFINFGVSNRYLKDEYQKSLLGIVSLGCKDACRGCGANSLGKCSIGLAD